MDIMRRSLAAVGASAITMAVALGGCGGSHSPAMAAPEPVITTGSYETLSQLVDALREAREARSAHADARADLELKALEAANDLSYHRMALDAAVEDGDVNGLDQSRLALNFATANGAYIQRSLALVAFDEGRLLSADTVLRRAATLAHAWLRDNAPEDAGEVTSDPAGEAHLHVPTHTVVGVMDTSEWWCGVSAGHDGDDDVRLYAGVERIADNVAQQIIQVRTRLLELQDTRMRLRNAARELAAWANDWLRTEAMILIHQSGWARRHTAVVPEEDLHWPSFDLDDPEPTAGDWSDMTDAWPVD